MGNAGKQTKTKTTKTKKTSNTQPITNALTAGFPVIPQSTQSTLGPVNTAKNGYLSQFGTNNFTSSPNSHVTPPTQVPTTRVAPVNFPVIPPQTKSTLPPINNAQNGYTSQWGNGTTPGGQPSNPLSPQPGPTKPENIKSEQSTSRDYGGALLGLGQAGIAAALQGKSSWETIRRREKEVDQALQSNLQDRERVLNQTPEATRRAQAAQLNQGKSLAVQAAANVGAGQASQAGLSGGDTSSAVLSAVKASAPVMQASQGYDSQLSGNYAQRDNAEANINNQAMQNTMMRGQLAEMTNYTDREHQADNTWANFAANATNSALNGVNALENFKQLGTQKNTVYAPYKNAQGKLVYKDSNGKEVEVA